MCEVVQMPRKVITARTMLSQYFNSASSVVRFPGARRAAQIAGQRCHHYAYGLTTTQALQAAAARFHENTGKSPAYSAMRLVRPPEDPFFPEFAA
jgi:hypothetical protein